MKPYVERHTNDATDAEAICEAVQRPNMRFVPVKSTEQQAGLMLHRTRHLLVRHKTAASSSIRAFLAELGIVAPIGRNGLDELLRLISEGKDARIPPLARTRLVTLSIQLFALREHIAILDRRLLGWRRTNEMAKRLSKFPGVGPALATALVASVADPKVFRSGRDFSAWIGLVPKQNSSDGKERLGNITKAGDRYLRSLFTAGALSVVKYAKIHGTTHRPWLAKLLERRPVRVAAVALAKKTGENGLGDEGDGSAISQACRIVHHKTGEVVWHPLEADGERFYPELERLLGELHRLAVPVVVSLAQRGAVRPYSFSYAKRIVREARRAAGLPEHVTMTACRHGGMTELGDAELTEQGVMSLSGHRTPDAARGYVKKTDAQRLAAARKRRAWVLELEHARNEMATMRTFVLTVYV